MKPRFSILGLLGITAYVAITLAGIAQPRSYWPEAAFYFSVLGLVYLVTVACGPTGRFAVFARGMVLGFMLFPIVRQLEPVYFDSNRLLLLNWYWSFRKTNKALDGMDTLAEQFNQTVFGLICGLLALWRYRVLQRREKEQSE